MLYFHLFCIGMSHCSSIICKNKTILRWVIFAPLLKSTGHINVDLFLNSLLYSLIYMSALMPIPHSLDYYAYIKSWHPVVLYFGYSRPFAFPHIFRINFSISTTKPQACLKFFQIWKYPHYQISRLTTKL